MFNYRPPGGGNAPTLLPTRPGRSLPANDIRAEQGNGLPGCVHTTHLDSRAAFTLHESLTRKLGGPTHRGLRVVGIEFVICELTLAFFFGLVRVEEEGEERARVIRRQGWRASGG